MKRWPVAIGLVLVVAAGFVLYRQFSVRLVVPAAVEPVVSSLVEPVKTESTEEQFPPRPASLAFVNLPPGFSISVFANNLSPAKLSTPGPGSGPRLMALKGDAVYVAVPARGEVIVLKDQDKNWVAEEPIVFISGLKRPHSVAFLADWVYIATEDKVVRVRDANADNRADNGTLQELVKLPTGGHWTRTVKIISDQLYISIGSSCNVCNESDSLRASILRCNLDGTACATFASGLRNTVDFIEYQGKLYGTDNGRDRLGNDLPPEEVNIISEGQDYGWPNCYGQRIHDTEFDKNQYVRDPCADTVPPLIELPAHIAPLGLTFYTGTSWPSAYRGSIFVAAHGSWNRQPPAGYEILQVNPETKQVNKFVSGWLAGSLVHGRPVGLLEYRGALLVSDDTAGLIYLISYAP